MDPITKYPGPSDVKDLLNKYYGYNLVLAKKYSTDKAFTVDDFLQVGRMALIDAYSRKPNEVPSYYKQAMRFGMLKFKRDAITKVNRNEEEYQRYQDCFTNKLHRPNSM
jgi:DNA-directed RNA polymerase specialized sigma subunit